VDHLLLRTKDKHSLSRLNKLYSGPVPKV